MTEGSLLNWMVCGEGKYLVTHLLRCCGRWVLCVMSGFTLSGGTCSQGKDLTSFPPPQIKMELNQLLVITYYSNIFQPTCNVFLLCQLCFFFLICLTVYMTYCKLMVFLIILTHLLIMLSGRPTLWDLDFVDQLCLSTNQMPRNGFEEMIQWTKEGKMWQYPISNEAGEY